MRLVTFQSFDALKDLVNISVITSGTVSEKIP